MLLTAQALRRSAEATRGDEAEIAGLFGLTAVESATLDERLRGARGSLERQHPVLRQIANREVLTGESCSSEIAARALSLADGDGDGIEMVDAGCKWVQYTAALALCTAGGPVLYWPCAYIAYCSLCTDDFGICY